MAEEPVIHFYARQLGRALKGQKVTVEFGIRKLKAMESTIRGLTITAVEAHGKQIRIHLSDTRIILVHLMMWGSWRVYRRSARWDKPAEADIPAPCATGRLSFSDRPAGLPMRVLYARNSFSGGSDHHSLRQRHIASLFRYTVEANQSGRIWL